MTGMKDSGVPWVGDIPESWQVKPMYSLGAPVRQLNSDSRETNLLSLSYGKIIRKDIESSTGLLPESFDGYQIVEKGDLVFRFTDLQNDQRSLRSGLVHEKGIITNAYLGFRPKKINSRYLDYLMRAYDLQKVFYAMGSGLRQSLTYSEVRRLPIIFPPLEEQRRIADYLDRELVEIDELSKRLTSLSQILNERRQAFVFQMVTEGAVRNRDLAKTKEFWLGQVPEGWTIRKIGHLFKSIGSGTTPPADREDLYEGHIPWVTTGELRENEITQTQKSVSQKTLAEFSALKIYPKGSLVVALYGATIGRLAFLGVDATVNQACCALTEPKGILPRFAFYTLGAMRERLIAEAVGGSQPNISQDILRNFQIPLPPIDEQRQIVETLDAQLPKLDAVASVVDKTLEKLGQRRNSLVSEAVSGKAIGMAS